jgi:hypothetical protein
MHIQIQSKNYDVKYLCKYLTEEHLPKVQEPNRNNSINSPAEIAFSDIVLNIGQMFKDVNNEESVRNNLSNIIAAAFILVSEANEHGICISNKRCQEIIAELDSETKRELEKFIEYKNNIVRTLDLKETEDNSSCKCDSNETDSTCETTNKNECSNTEENCKNSKCNQEKVVNTEEPNEQVTKRNLDCDETGCYIK